MEGGGWRGGDTGAVVVGVGDGVEGVEVVLGLWDLDEVLVSEERNRQQKRSQYVNMYASCLEG